MTRLEVLETYSNVQKKDTWKLLGELSIVSTSRSFVKDLIYKINIPESILDGYLILCKETISTTFDWTQVKIVNEVELSFISNIISPIFTIILTEEELTPIINDPVDDAFTPFTYEENKIGDVIIDDETLETILLEVGVPFVEYDELEFSRKQIANLMVKPALHEYFKWFPKTVVEAYPLTTSNEFRIQFPSWAYQIVYASVTQARVGSQNGGGISNPLLRYYDEMMWSASNPMLGNTTSTPTSRALLYDWSSMLMEKSARQAIINHGTRIHYEVIKENNIRYLKGYANKQGTLQVGWAQQSLDVNDVEFARLPEFKKLCKSYVLRAIGSLRTQGSLNDKNLYDYKEFINRADKLEEEVLKDWRSMVKYSGIIRGSH